MNLDKTPTLSKSGDDERRQHNIVRALFPRTQPPEQVFDLVSLKACIGITSNNQQPNQGHHVEIKYIHPPQNLHQIIPLLH